MENDQVSRPRESLATISLIVPCWKESKAVAELAKEWATFPGVLETILVGVNEDETFEDLAEIENVRFCTVAKPARGPQMNLGASLATGDVLLFHHADSLLTRAQTSALARAMSRRDFVGGAFYRKFDERHPHLLWLEKWERLHCRLFGTLYGDQSIFVRREMFSRLGGFASIPLMEDVEFSRRLRRSGAIVMLDPPMKTSPRRHMDQGAWKVTLQNAFFLALFHCGLPPGRLHRSYYAGNLRENIVPPPSEAAVSIQRADELTS